MHSILGKKVKDVVTGFSGTVTGYAEYLTGCAQVLLVPPIKPDGTLADGNWFDIQRVQEISTEVVTLDNSKTPGPDKQAPRNY